MTIQNDSVFLNPGDLAQVAQIVHRLAAQRIMMVVDRAAYDASGAAAVLQPILETLDVSWFCDFELNPKLADVQRGVDQARAFAPDLVIALGGGTAIDLGKLISSLSHQDASPREIVTGQASIGRAGTPLLAIPTTSGTGSEATHFAVAYVGHDKYSIADDSLLPRYTIVDAQLTYSLPATITAATGLDAFCQAIESIWAVGSTDESIGYAVAAGRFALQHLVAATHDPTPADRLGMCRAAHLAGRAINISKTTASHALSYPLTSLHEIPHGIAVAMTLSPMLAYNAQVSDSDCTDPRGAEAVRRRIAIIVELLEAADVADACQRIEAFFAELGCPSSLAEAGICDDQALRQIVDSVNTQRLSNNPRSASPETLLQLLKGNLAENEA
ncbi:Aldehyde-alcohol dehydrogenase [Rosistilla carotiformis]|uniref:Aldehyde-alcohol dehydrogenase n=1 Tax=Rosistilla carotiformis TaxID=2528017 RepID=A0A518JYR9_9BACT|nr:phosphonoacetaldehyde reductase [Rosistilla carotiformis]QDV70684.1 Aldehyde-alcohol dehydrogenase [Rosistilla carotiformis]